MYLFVASDTWREQAIWWISFLYLTSCCQHSCLSVWEGKEFAKFIKAPSSHLCFCFFFSAESGRFPDSQYYLSARCQSQGVWAKTTLLRPNSTKRHTKSHNRIFPPFSVLSYIHHSRKATSALRRFIHANVFFVMIIKVVINKNNFCCKSKKMK